MAVFPDMAGDASRGLLIVSLLLDPGPDPDGVPDVPPPGPLRVRVTNAAWLITPMLNVTVNGVLAITGSITVDSAVATWIGGMLIGTSVMAWAVHRRLDGFGRPEPKLAREMLSFGLKAHLGRAMLFGNYRADQWILGVMASSRELGLYSVAVAWSEVLFFLPTTLVAVQRPDLVRASPEEARKRATVVLRGTLALTLGCTVVMILLAPVLCTTIFGEDVLGLGEMLRAARPRLARHHHAEAARQHAHRAGPAAARDRRRGRGLRDRVRARLRADPEPRRGGRLDRLRGLLHARRAGGGR